MRIQGDKVIVYFIIVPIIHGAVHISTDNKKKLLLLYVLVKNSRMRSVLTLPAYDIAIEPETHQNRDVEENPSSVQPKNVPRLCCRLYYKCHFRVDFNDT